MGRKTHDAAWHRAKLEREHRDRKCTGKIKHEHMGTALQHATSLRRKTPGANISMYDCKYCGFVHIGNSRNPKELTEYHETSDDISLDNSDSCGNISV